MHGEVGHNNLIFIRFWAAKRKHFCFCTTKDSPSISNPSQFEKGVSRPHMQIYRQTFGRWNYCGFHKWSEIFTCCVESCNGYWTIVNDILYTREAGLSASLWLHFSSEGIFRRNLHAEQTRVWSLVQWLSIYSAQMSQAYWMIIALQRGCVVCRSGARLRIPENCFESFRRVRDSSFLWLGLYFLVFRDTSIVFQVPLYSIAYTSISSFNVFPIWTLITITSM